MLINREKVTETFQNYVNKYDVEDPRVKLKIEHTYRVAELCEEIAKYLNYSKEDMTLAWLIGMLHDIGRFEQLKNFGTFSDAKSINHAKYGVEILFEKGEIRNYIEADGADDLIYTSIINHNIYALPDTLDERTKEFCDLIRDADKIDILKVNAELPVETIYDFNEDQIKQSVVTKEVMESYFMRQAIHHKLKKSPIDHVIGHVSLAFELVFPVSVKIVMEQGYLYKILEFEPENQTAKEQLSILRDDLNVYFK